MKTTISYEVLKSTRNRLKEDVISLNPLTNQPFFPVACHGSVMTKQKLGFELLFAMASVN